MGKRSFFNRFRPQTPPSSDEVHPVTFARPSDPRTTRQQPIAQDVSILEPSTYRDVTEVAAKLIQEKAIIVTLNKVTTSSEATRIIDFLAGVVFCQNGDIRQIDQATFHLSIK